MLRIVSGCAAALVFLATADTSQAIPINSPAISTAFDKVAGDAEFERCMQRARARSRERQNRGQKSNMSDATVACFTAAQRRQGL